MNRKPQYYNRPLDKLINEAETRGASRAIEKTIRKIKYELGVDIPRGSTPSESRAIMVSFLSALV